MIHNFRFIAKLSPEHLLDSNSHYDDECQQDQESFTTLAASSDLLSSIETVRMSSISRSFMHEEHDHVLNEQRQLILSDDPTNRKMDEYSKFGDFVVEVMRNMSKSQARSFQMKVMALIVDVEQNN